MTAAVVAHWAALAALCVLFGCAYSDVRDRTIPNVAVFGLAVLGLIEAAALQRADIVRTFLVAGLLFIGLMPLHRKGVLGGGDLKLIAALMLWLAPLQAGLFLLLVLASGGVVGLIFLVFGRLRAWVVPNASPAVSVPYALAIAGGFLAIRPDLLQGVLTP